MRISIIGTRTVGKTTIGKILAKELNIKFIDFDEYAEKKLKKYGGIYGFVDKNSKKIGTKRAWGAYWNSQGRNLIELYTKNRNLIVAIGGTIFAQPFSKVKRNAKTIKENSRIIALIPHKNDKIGIDLLTSRELKRHYNKKRSGKEIRKIVKRDYLSIKNLIIKMSDMTIYVNNKKPKQIVKEIIKKLK